MQQRRLTPAFATQILGRSGIRANIICTQSADMHDPAHGMGGTGVRQRLRQSHMHLFKRSSRAVQDCHQVDDGVVPHHRAAERRRIMHTHFQHREGRQVLNMLRVASAPRGHCDVKALAHQFFTHMGADEASTA